MSKLVSLLLAIREDENKNNRFYSIQGVHLKLGDSLTYIIERTISTNEVIKQSILLHKIKDTEYAMMVRDVVVGMLYFDSSERYLVKVTTSADCVPDSKFIESYYNIGFGEENKNNRAVTARGTKSYNGVNYTINGTAWGVCLNSNSGDTEYSIFPGVISSRADVFKKNIEVDTEIYQSQIVKLTKTSVAGHSELCKTLMNKLASSTEDARQAKKELEEAKKREREDTERAQDMTKLVDIGIELGELQDSIWELTQNLDRMRLSIGRLREKLVPYINSGYVVEDGKHYRVRQGMVFKGNEKHSEVQGITVEYNKELDSYLALELDVAKKKARTGELLGCRHEILAKQENGQA